MAKPILAIDQGTTGTTALVVSLDGETLGRKTVEFPQHFPKPGWVEHDAAEIWRSVEESIRGAIAAAPLCDGCAAEGKGRGRRARRG
jgi:glycerol kinase